MHIIVRAFRHWPVRKVFFLARKALKNYKFVSIVEFWKVYEIYNLVGDSDLEAEYFLLNLL